MGKLWGYFSLLLPVLCGLTAPAFAQSYVDTDYGPLCFTNSDNNGTYTCTHDGVALATSTYEADFSSYTADYLADTNAVCADVIRAHGVEPSGPDMQVLAGCSINLSIWFDGESSRGDKTTSVGIHGLGNLEGQDFTEQYLGKGHLAVEGVSCGCWLRQAVPD